MTYDYFFFIVQNDFHKEWQTRVPGSRLHVDRGGGSDQTLASWQLRHDAEGDEAETDEPYQVQVTQPCHVNMFSFRQIFKTKFIIDILFLISFFFFFLIYFIFS